jgi:hypothetical protein
VVDPAVQAEVNWLNGDTTVASLLAPAGVLPYVRANPPGDARVCWLFRTRVDESREANQLKRLTHYFQLRIKWPLVAADANVAALQAAADTLVAALLVRIRGSAQDKTHGYFFSVGESLTGTGNAAVSVQYGDIEQAIRNSVPLQIDITYPAVQTSISG